MCQNPQEKEKNSEYILYMFLHVALIVLHRKVILTSSPRFLEKILLFLSQINYK